MSELEVSVPIRKYEQMLRDCAKLEALESAGVDNWSGYHQIYDEDYQGEEELSLMEEAEKQIEEAIEGIKNAISRRKVW